MKSDFSVQSYIDGLLTGAAIGAILGALALWAYLERTEAYEVIPRANYVCTAWAADDTCRTYEVSR